MDFTKAASTEKAHNMRTKKIMKNRVRSKAATEIQKNVRRNIAKKKYNSKLLDTFTSIFNSKNMSNVFANRSASYAIKKGGSSVEKNIKRTRKRGCTKTNPKPPCGAGFYEKISKKGDICCYKQKKTKKNNVDNMYFYLGAY
jgi:hypothetical protein